MEIKNGQLMIYRVDKDYLKHLAQIDKNVRKKYERKYYGIIITNNNIDYCIPFTSRIKNRNGKLTINIQDKNVTIAQLTLNNMIPVKASVVELVDISKEKDKDYLNKEIRYLRRKEVKKIIIEKTENIFYVLSNESHDDYKFFKELCGNFKILEDECKRWNGKGDSSDFQLSWKYKYNKCI